MPNNFPKIPLFFSITFFVLSGIVFIFFYRVINNNNQELQLKEGEWHFETNKRNEIEALDNAVKAIAPERAQLETHFAKSSDVVPFLDTIEKLGFMSNVKVEITSVDILENYIGMMIQVKASGTFNSLYKFLTLLENSPYELEFIGVDIRKQAGADVKSAKWDALFKIKLLSFIK